MAVKGEARESCSCSAMAIEAIDLESERNEK